MPADEPTPRPASDDDRTGELIPPEPAAGSPLAPGGASGDRRVPEGKAAAALAELLAQQQRDASAQRAQTRELTRTLGELRTSQEYLGEALREERGGGARTWIAVLVALVAVAGLGWWAQGRFSEVNRSVNGRLSAMEDGEREERLALLEKAHADRVASLEASLAEVRGLLDRARTENGELRSAGASTEDRLQRERAAWAEQERALSRRIAQLERENGAITGLETRIESLKDRLGVEAARADGLEREVRELRAAASVPAPPPADDSSSTTTPDVRVTDVTPAPGSADPPAKTPPQKPDLTALRAGATRDKAELERITSSLNALLELSPGATSYRIVKLGGVSGRELLDVRIEGTKDDRVERAIEAPLARITVDGGESNVLIDFRDGELIRGPLRAPFFEGRYGLLLDADAKRWSAANLSFVTIE